MSGRMRKWARRLADSVNPAISSAFPGVVFFRKTCIRGWASILGSALIVGGFPYCAVVAAKGRSTGFPVRLPANSASGCPPSKKGTASAVPPLYPFLRCALSDISSGLQSRTTHDAGGPSAPESIQHAAWAASSSSHEPIRNGDHSIVDIQESTRTVAPEPEDGAPPQAVEARCAHKSVHRPCPRSTWQQPRRSSEISS